MPLCPMPRLLAHARGHGYAVGYFESFNMDALLAVAEAAERTRSPVILGFGGQFLESARRERPEDVRHYGALCASVARQIRVPCALLLNEALTEDTLCQALDSGFNAIMYENPDTPPEECVRIHARLARRAHAVGACVEAELGDLPSADIATGRLSHGSMTDPAEAAAFVEATGIDALAVSVGNVHLLEDRKATMDFSRIEALTRAVRVPLVLHGGTGVSEEEMKRAIAMGLCKINVGTALKRVYLNAMREYLGAHETARMDPHDILGRGGPLDLLSCAREAVTREVERFMRVFGCVGRADEVL